MIDPADDIFAAPAQEETFIESAKYMGAVLCVSATAVCIFIAVDLLG